MTKKEVREVMSQIQQEELKLKEIEERVESFSAKARECRDIAYTLQTGEPNPETATKISEFLRQANYYESLAEHTMHSERYTQVQNLDLVKETAVRLRHIIKHNRNILSEYLESLDDVKRTAHETVENAEQKISNLEFLITEQAKELVALEGGHPNG
ncbi:hypothetical protein [Paenibacillus sp. FSL L8-0506]|uniref:hypothetical protein n=1 Tax=Paenibacillus sp. FSL L8-0506 TaxID=2975335 RepID=UPI0030F4F014